jgi:CRP/FNR family cyclic AMP-dependent transcriptional regulator
MRKVLNILGYFNDEDIAWMTQVGTKQKILPEQYLIKKRERLTSIYLVLDGMFSVELKSSLSIAKVKSGEVLGEMSFVEEDLPSVDVKADKPSSVICIDHEFMLERFDQVPGFKARFYNAMCLCLSSRLRAVTRQLSNKQEEDLESNDLNVLDSNIDNATLRRVQIAGERFNRLLSHFS